MELRRRSICISLTLACVLVPSSFPLFVVRTSAIENHGCAPHLHDLLKNVDWWRDADGNGVFDETKDPHNHRDEHGFNIDPIYDGSKVWDCTVLRIDADGTFDKGHGFINEWKDLGGGLGHIPTYGFHAGDNMPAKAKKLVRQAFQAWSGIESDKNNHRVGLEFRPVDWSDTDPPMIQIHWHDIDPPAVTDVDTIGPVFANITFDKDPTPDSWEYESVKKVGTGEIHFLTVALHEVGHVVGLSHVSSDKENMYRKVTVGKGPWFDKLTPGSVHGARDLYMIELQPPTPPKPKGPKSNVTMSFFPDATSAYGALIAGQIEIMAYPLTAAQAAYAINDPNIILAPYRGLDMFTFDLNNNETIPSYPGVTSPMSYVDFRKALWCLTDRDYYTQVLAGELATPIYVPIAAPQMACVNSTVEDYVRTVWAYNMQTAANYLDARGFYQRVGDPNPYYDPGVLGSAQYWRGYPPDSSRAGQRLDPLIFSARVDDPLRYAAGAQLRDRMLESGIPVDFYPEPLSSAFLRVMAQRDYHIYTGSWMLGRFPLHLYQLYHSDFYDPSELNYVVSSTSPGYDRDLLGVTDLDTALEELWFAPTISGGVTAAKDAQALLVQKYATVIPLWSSNSYFAYRNLFGVTNMDAYGIMNDYTFLSAYRADGGDPIRVGLAGTPLIPITLGSERFGGVSPPYIPKSAVWSFDWSSRYVLDRITETLPSIEPYNLLNDQPWLVQDWTTAPGGPSFSPWEWIDPEDGETKSWMRFWLRDDVLVNAGDIPIDLTLYNLHHITEDPFGTYIDVYFDVKSYWVTYWIGEMPLLNYPAVVSMYEVWDFLPGARGWIELQANPNYFMETPPQGEVDWYWNWINTEPVTYPRDGYYWLNIYDLTTSSYAFGGSGNGVPTSNWVPSADLVAPIGQIDIFDVSVAAANYLLTFGSPPPDPPPPPPP